MAGHEAVSYQDPGTPEEQSRRTFMANATLVVGGIIGLTLAIPLAASLVPESLLKGTGGGTPYPLTDADMKALQGATQTPVTIHINYKYTDGYLPGEVNADVWGVKLSPEQVAGFKAKRPDLFSGDGKVDYPVVNMSFVIFSSICPHLGCRFLWNKESNRFACPCHGSQFGFEGEYLAGPAPRGLDPLPLRSENGKAEVTWIQYKQGQPGRLIVSYT